LGSFGTLAMKQNNSSWDKLNEKTWKGDNGWGGMGYTFYVNKKGERSYCYQIYGSGVPVTSEEFGKVEIKNDTVLLSIFDIGTAKSYPTGSFVFKSDTKLVSLDKQVTLTDSKAITVYYKFPVKSGLRDISELKNR